MEPELRQRATEILGNALRCLEQLHGLLAPSIDLLRAVELERDDQRVAQAVREWSMVVTEQRAEGEEPGRTAENGGRG